MEDVYGAQVLRKQKNPLHLLESLTSGCELLINTEDFSVSESNSVANKQVGGSVSSVHQAGNDFKKNTAMTTAQSIDSSTAMLDKNASDRLDKVLQDEKNFVYRSARRNIMFAQPITNFQTKVKSHERSRNDFRLSVTNSGEQ